MTAWLLVLMIAAVALVWPFPQIVTLLPQQMRDRVRTRRGPSSDT
jgi:hypothetical protein